MCIRDRTAACSNPLYRRAIRVSMGTVFQIPWTILDSRSSWPGPGISQLRALGFKTAAMALSDDSIPIDDARLTAEGKLALILGTEGDGLPQETIADCDYTVRIPMSLSLIHISLRQYGQKSLLCTSVSG